MAFNAPGDKSENSVRLFRNEARSALCGIIREYGPEVCEPSSRVRSFLNDLCGECKAEINLLITTLMVCRLPYFQAVKKGQAEQLLVMKAEMLHYELSMTKEAVHWAMETWALALGIIATPLPPAITAPVVSISRPTPVPEVLESPQTESRSIPLASHLPEAAFLGGLPPTVAGFSPSHNAAKSVVRSPAAVIGITLGIGFLCFLFFAFVTNHLVPQTSQLPQLPVVDSSAAVSPPPDPAVGRRLAMTHNIEDIRSGLEPGTLLVWPLSGKENGLKIILPSKPSSQIFLMGNHNLRQGCDVIRSKFEQALRESGYSENEIAGCSVFACTATGEQLAFSTATAPLDSPSTTTMPVNASSPDASAPNPVVPDSSQTFPTQDTGAAP